MLGCSHDALRIKSACIVLMIVFSGLAGFIAIAPATVVAASGDLVVDSAMTISDTIYYVDGNVTIQTGGTLTIQNAELRFVSDDAHPHALTVNAGNLILIGGTVTAYLDQINSYPFLDMTITNGGKLTATEGSKIAFPGSITVTGATSTVELWDTTITCLDSTMLTTYYSADAVLLDQADDGPTISITASTWKMYDSSIDSLPEYPAVPAPGANLAVAGAGKFTAVNSYLSVDFNDAVLSASTHNTLRLDGTSRAYLYGCVFETPVSSIYGDSAISTAAGDTAICVPTADTAEDNTTGQSVASLWVEDDGLRYQVIAKANMSVSSFDTTGLTSDASAVSLILKYSVSPTYNGGARAIYYQNGATYASLGVIPAVGQTNVVYVLDMLARGVNTLAEIANLKISYYNGGTGGDVQFDALYLVVTVGPQAYIYRWADITVVDMYGTPLTGATINAKFSGSSELDGKTCYYYSATGIAYNPPSDIYQTYLGKTVGTYKVTNSSGKAIIPYLTDIISGDTFPNSWFVGTLELNASYGGYYSLTQQVFDPFPAMKEGNGVKEMTLQIPQAVAGGLDPSKYLIVPPDKTISGGSYTHYGDIIARTGGTLTISDSDFWIQRNPGETSSVVIGSGGKIQIIDSSFDSNQPVSVDVMAGGTLIISGSEIGSSVDVTAYGNANVQITDSNIEGTVTSDSASSSVIEIAGSTLYNSLTIGGSTVATLTNVTINDMPSIIATETARASVYRWVMVTVKDGINADLSGAVISARGQLNGTLVKTAVSNATGKAGLRLLAFNVTASGTQYTGNYNISAMYTFVSQNYYSQYEKLSLQIYTSPLIVSNPEITLTILVGRPDLAVGPTGIYTYPLPLTEGDPTATVNLHVQNIGDAAAGAFNVEFYYELLTNPGVLISIATSPVVGLAAGAGMIVSTPWDTTAITGLINVYGMINPAHAVAERSYDNNNASTTITIYTKVDLTVVETITFNGQANPTQVWSSRSITVTALITNNGQTPVEATDTVMVAIYNQTISAANLMQYKLINVLIENGGSPIPVAFTVQMPGVNASMAWTIWVVVNPSPAQGGTMAPQLDESTYANNADSKSFTLIDSRADISVVTEDIKVFLGTKEVGLNSSVNYSDKLTIIITVRNIGLTPASEFSVSLNLSGAEPATVGETAIGVQYTSLNSSLSVNVTFIYTVIAKFSGKYNLTVTLDMEGAVNDKNRSNNFAVRMMNVSYITPYITITMPLANTNITPNMALRIEGKVLYPDRKTPMSNVLVTVVIRNLAGVNVTSVETDTTSSTGAFDVTIIIPENLAPGQYNIRVEVGLDHQNRAVTVPPQELPLWMWIAIAGAILGAVLAFSFFIYRQGVGKLVECGECGALIPESAKKCPKCGVEFEEDMVKCSECGAWIASDSLECPNCHVRFGTPLEGEKTYEDKMRDQYEEGVVSKYRDLAKAELGKDYNDDIFKEWWTANPAYISFEDWLVKEEERRKQANLMTCQVCGTPNAKDESICHNCGSPLQAETAEGTVITAPVGTTPDGVVVEKRVIRKPIDRKIVPKKVIKKPLDQDQQQGGQQQQ